MNIPSTLDPETAAWMRTQMTIAAARAVEPLQAQMRGVEDFANGLLIVLANVIPHVLATNPELAAMLAPKWKAAAEQFERMELANVYAEGDSTLDLLEARKLMYRLGGLKGAWPKHRAADVIDMPLQSGRAQLRAGRA